MDLFTHNQDFQKEQPLAEKMRPKDLKGLLLSESSKQQLSFLLQQQNFVTNCILYGPPGVGKSSLMRLVEQSSSGYRYLWLNAVDISAKELREQCNQAKEHFLMHSEKTILFIDEIHRLSRAQQDVLLPAIEASGVVLMGATTEKPFAALTRPLLSRCRVVTLHRLSEKALGLIAEKAVSYMGFLSIDEFIEEKALKSLLAFSHGDARKLLGLLETLNMQIKDKPISSENLAVIRAEDRPLPLSSSDFKVQNTSALIKSMRGSDLEASLLYVVRLVEAGIDPIYIYRRLIVFASEDIGNADPQALVIVTNAKISFEAIGMPEGYYGLIQVVEYLSKAPKSRKTVEFLGKAKSQAWPSMKESPPTHLQLKGSGAKFEQNLPKSNFYGFLQED